MTLVLSFYGDGPKWENFVYPPASPSGCSYFRPFRYRDEWVETGLLDRLKDEWEDVAREELLVGARFKSSPWEWSLLPVRKAEMTYFRFNEGEEHYIHFKVGSMFDFRERVDPQTLALSIPEDERERVGKAFFFESKLDLSAARFVDLESERAAWAGLADSLARTSLPVPSQVRNAVFLRVQWPLKGASRVTAKELERSEGEGPLHGFKLAEGATYEFEFAHRYPSYIGTDERMPPFRVDLATSDDVVVTPRDEEISGNYQTHFFRTSGGASQKLSSQLILDPPDEALPNGEGQRPIPRIKVPIRVVPSLWFRLRTRWVWFLVLLIGLFLSNFIAFSSDNDIVEGDLLRFTIGATVAALAIFASQQHSSK